MARAAVSPGAPSCVRIRHQIRSGEAQNDCPGDVAGPDMGHVGVSGPFTSASECTSSTALGFLEVGELDIPRPGGDELLARVIEPGPRMMNPALAERADGNGGDKARPGQRSGVDHPDVEIPVAAAIPGRYGRVEGLSDTRGLRNSSSARKA